MLNGIINNIVVVTPLLTLLLGLFLGHRFTLWRDKRKEFNDLSRETYKQLVSNIKRRNTEKVHIEVSILSHYFCFVRRRRFIKAVQEYQDAKDGSTYNPCTGVFTTNEKDIDAVILCAKKVSTFLTPR